MQDTVFVVPPDFFKVLSREAPVYFMAPPDELHPYGPPPTTDSEPKGCWTACIEGPFTACVDGFVSLLKLPLACITCLGRAQLNNHARRSGVTVNF